MASITWSREAQENLSAIHAYIARENPAVADSIIDDLIDATNRLASFPQSGRSVEELNDKGVREVIAVPYRIAYIISGDAVTILRVWHGKQLLRPSEFQA